MTNFKFWLLISALTVVEATENCPTDDTEMFRNDNKDLEDLSMEKINLKLKKIIQLSSKKKFEASLVLIQNMNLELSKKYNLSQTIKEVPLNAIQIETISRKFHDFVQSINASTNITVVNEYFIKIENISKQISSALENLSDLTVGKQLFQLARQYIRESNPGICDRKRLTQGHVWNFYNLLFGMEYKGSLLLITAYQHLTITGIGDYRRRIEEVRKAALKRFLEYSKEARGAMENAPREIIKCDDGKHVKNQTYVELQGISQGFLIDPILIEQTIKLNSCPVSEPQNDFCDFYRPDLCLYKRCSESGGKLDNCRDLSEGFSGINKLTMCPAEDEAKRYSWVTFDAKTFGNYTPDLSICKKPSVNRELRLSFPEKNKTTVVQEKMCFCDCKRTEWNLDDIRTISFAWTEANFTENRVITNIKFEEANGMIHLRAQHGRLLFGGRIDSSSVSWIETPNLLKYKNVNADAPYYIDKTENHIITWLPNRDFKYISTNLSMNLDDLVGLENHVVVGVALQKVDGNQDGIQLKIRTRTFNYINGILNSEIVEHSSSNKIPRQNVDLGSPGNPALIKEKKDVFSKPHQVVQFRQTDWKKDLGQSIVPFFDTRPVEPIIALPLSGIGLYHQGCKDCGGFVALKLITYDISQNFWKG